MPPARTAVPVDAAVILAAAGVSREFIASSGGLLLPAPLLSEFICYNSSAPRKVFMGAAYCGGINIY